MWRIWELTDMAGIISRLGIVQLYPEIMTCSTSSCPTLRCWSQNPPVWWSSTPRTESSDTMRKPGSGCPGPPPRSSRPGRIPPRSPLPHWRPAALWWWGFPQDRSRWICTQVHLLYTMRWGCVRPAWCPPGGTKASEKIFFCATRHC